MRCNGSKTYNPNLAAQREELVEKGSILDDKFRAKQTDVSLQQYAAA